MPRVRSLNLFLAFQTFLDGMGGNTGRALLYEGLLFQGPPCVLLP